jgi:hypothetical protein
MFSEKALTMCFDVIKVGRVLERRIVPVEVLHPLVNVGISIPNGAVVALEMAMVDGVETNDCGVQTNVGFSHAVTDEEDFSVRIGAFCLLGFENLFYAVQGLEEGFDGCLVGSLGGGKARPIYTI